MQHFTSVFHFFVILFILTDKQYFIASPCEVLFLVARVSLLLLYYVRNITGKCLQLSV